MDYAKESLRLHGEWKGKIEVTARVPVETKDDLSLAYTPGVAQPCLEIQKDIEKSYELTRRWNLCAVITDGSAVLGLGDIGPEAGMPVMEGKCVLFKAFGDVDAFPLCVKTHDVDEFVNTVALISGSFGGVNLEDISAPRCFEIERKLKERCDIPIFHDDQHGTAVITLAGLTNALKVVGKTEDVKIVTSGAGAAAIAIVKLLLSAGFKNVTMCDRKGAIYKGRDGLNWIKEEMAEVTNLERRAGSLADMLVGAGTVTTPELVTRTRDAGGQFIISPDTNPAVIARTRELELVSMPGAMTPSEILAAHAAGADLVKLFPAAALGPAYLKAVRSPISHVRIMAVGGINEKNAAEFLKAGAVGLGVGGNLANRQWIADGAFEKITQTAQALVTAVRTAE